MHNILCATDGSEHSQIAVDYATRLTKLSGGKLVFLAVNVAFGGPRGGTSFLWDDAELGKLLDKAASTASEAGISEVSGVMIKSRDAARAIVQYAEENNVDHIVVGTGGKNAVARLLLGSVARDVASRAHCSITIAR
jgi:nucleotide-binding universal stress UspA family protein